VKEKILRGLSDSVLEMEEEKTIDYANQAISENVDPLEALDKGLADGMKRAGDLYEEGDYYIPELLLCSDALNAGVDVLKPHITVSEADSRKTKVVIGVIEGDTHDIGKNIVKVLAEAGGFEVFDIGRDVPPERFITEAREKEADVIAISTLMSTTMAGMERVIGLLREKGIRDDFKVIVGGGPISQNYADRIGADGYSANAVEAVRLLRELVKK
jgi:corrinoid protein of di/trimethylamine methyltransferase